MQLAAAKPSRRMWLRRFRVAEARRHAKGRPGTCDRIQGMPEEIPNPVEVAVNPFAAADIVDILSDRGWLVGEPSPEQHTWCERAAAMLGPHATDRAALGDLLSLIFHYDAAELMTQSVTHVTMSRYGAHDVLRQLARLALEKAPFDSERFKEVVTTLKVGLDVRVRELFQPLRLALAGRAGESEFDLV